MVALGPLPSATVRTSNRPSILVPSTACTMYPLTSFKSWNRHAMEESRGIIGILDIPKREDTLLPPRCTWRADPRIPTTKVPFTITCVTNVAVSCCFCCCRMLNVLALNWVVAHIFHNYNLYWSLTSRVNQVSRTGMLRLSPLLRAGRQSILSETLGQGNASPSSVLHEDRTSRLVPKDRRIVKAATGVPINFYFNQNSTVRSALI